MIVFTALINPGQLMLVHSVTQTTSSESVATEQESTNSLA